MVAHICNLSIWEIEAVGLLSIPGLPGLTLSCSKPGVDCCSLLLSVEHFKSILHFIFNCVCVSAHVCVHVCTCTWMHKWALFKKTCFYLCLWGHQISLDWSYRYLRGFQLVIWSLGSEFSSPWLHITFCNHWELSPAHLLAHFLQSKNAAWKEAAHSPHTISKVLGQRLYLQGEDWWLPKGTDFICNRASWSLWQTVGM